MTARAPTTNVGAVWVVGLLLALGPDAGAKTELELEAKGGLELDLVGEIGVAKGDVVLRHAGVLVCCDEARAHFKDRAIARVECRGNVVIRRPSGAEATADLVVYEASRERLTLKGKASLSASDLSVSGETIVYDLATDHMEVLGQRARLRVQAERRPPTRRCPPEP